MNQQAQGRVSDGQALEHASVRQFCKAVKVPAVGANFVQLAEQAVKENRSHIGYLEALLATVSRSFLSGSYTATKVAVQYPFRGNVSLPHPGVEDAALRALGGNGHSGRPGL
jgi:hypothetical protein